MVLQNVVDPLSFVKTLPIVCIVHNFVHLARQKLLYINLVIFPSNGKKDKYIFVVEEKNVLGGTDQITLLTSTAFEYILPINEVSSWLYFVFLGLVITLPSQKCYSLFLAESLGNYKFRPRNTIEANNSHDIKLL